MIPLVVVGAGGLGREVAWLVDDINGERRTFEFLGFLDDHATETVEGYPVIGTVNGWLKKPSAGVQAVVAIGDPFVRHSVVQQFNASGVPFATLVHPSVQHSRWVRFGPGTIVFGNTSLTTNVDVGAHVLVNPNCAIGHDVRLHDFTSLMPGVRISGNVVTGVGSYFGVGSVVINQVLIGEWALVGAGAVVTKDLSKRVVAVGVPAKVIRRNERAPESDQINSP